MRGRSKSGKPVLKFLQVAPDKKPHPAPEEKAEGDDTIVSTDVEGEEEAREEAGDDDIVGDGDGAPDGTAMSPSAAAPATGKGDLEAQEEEEAPHLLQHVPYIIAHFLGYRRRKTENRALIRPLEWLPMKVETVIFAWIGALLGLSFVMICWSRWPKFSDSTDRTPDPWTTPIIIGSMGASSVILYGIPASPLGQPKSFIGGHFLSCLTAICITKLFHLSKYYDPDVIDYSGSLVWVCGGLSAATALAIMIITGTVHPPAGATALLGATSPPVVRLGWRYIPVILLSTTIMTAWTCVWMNLGRARYPHFWYDANKRVFRVLGWRGK